MLNIYNKSYKSFLAVTILFGAAIEVNAQDVTFNPTSAIGNNDQAMLYATKSKFISNVMAMTSEVISNEETNTKSSSSVAIGKQVWMKTNLDVSKYRNGDEIPQVQDPVQWANSLTGAWCYYENKTENGIVYGKLYNWYAVHDPRGLAPEGWHVPSDEEWTVLSDFLGGEAVAGGKMKATVLGKNQKDVDNNSVDFSGVLGGSRNDYLGKFFGKNTSGMWWSSTAVYGSYAWYRSLYHNNAEVNRNYLNKTIGFSVRCVKD